MYLCIYLSMHLSIAYHPSIISLLSITYLLCIYLSSIVYLFMSPRFCLSPIYCLFIYLSSITYVFIYLYACLPTYLPTMCSSLSLLSLSSSSSPLYTLSLFSLFSSLPILSLLSPFSPTLFFPTLSLLPLPLFLLSPLLSIGSKSLEPLATGLIGNPSQM